MPGQSISGRGFYLIVRVQHNAKTVFYTNIVRIYAIRKPGKICMLISIIVNNLVDGCYGKLMAMVAGIFQHNEIISHFNQGSVIGFSILQNDVQYDAIQRFELFKNHDRLDAYHSFTHFEGIWCRKLEISVSGSGLHGQFLIKLRFGRIQIGQDAIGLPFFLRACFQHDP